MTSLHVFCGLGPPIRNLATPIVQAELQSSQVGPKLSLKVLFEIFLRIPILSQAELELYLLLKSSLRIRALVWFTEVKGENV